MSTLNFTPSLESVVLAEQRVDSAFLHWKSTSQQMKNLSLKLWFCSTKMAFYWEHQALRSWQSSSWLT